MRSEVADMATVRPTFALAIALVVAAGCAPAKQPAAKSDQANSDQPPATAGVVSVPAAATDRLESAAPVQTTAPARSPEAQLVEAYRAAHAKKDVEAMLALYWFGDSLSGKADDEMRLTIRENVVAEMRCPLVDIKIEPVDPALHGPREEGGIRWRPSLEVTSMLTANFDTSAQPAGGYYTQRISARVGRRGERCYFAVPIRE
jgi:hypothetical protein